MQKTIYFIIVLLLLNGCISLNYQESNQLNNMNRRIMQSKSYHKSVHEFIVILNETRDKINSIKVNEQKTEAKDIAIKYDGLKIGNKIEVVIKSSGACILKYNASFDMANTSVFYRAAKDIAKYSCKNTIVKLHSGGGKVLEGIKIGLYIRESGWDTVPWTAGYIDNDTQCASTCAIAYLGGVNRYKLSLIPFMPKYGAGIIHFHQLSVKYAYDPICKTDPSDPSYVLLSSYFDYVMPDGATLLIGKVLNTPCNKLHNLTMHEKLYDMVYTGSYTPAVASKYDDTIFQ